MQGWERGRREESVSIVLVEYSGGPAEGIKDGTLGLRKKLT